jgi:phospholipid/cholesterol/gamma-HCH transport system ATP-binding protein
MPVTPKIELQSVAKSFGQNTVLKDISLQVAAGESLVIIGTSGCGKSVTLKCLNGLITPDQESMVSKFWGVVAPRWKIYVVVLA